MGIDEKHPLYSEFLEDWHTLRHSYRGERVVKQQGRRYLPPTPGQILDGMETGQLGSQNYEAYKLRSRFPGFVSEAVEALLGVMWRKPPVIELPERMEPLREKATVNGETLEMLLRRINEQQLVTGRLGILADVSDGAPVGTLPYIAMYKAEDIINWDDGARGDPLQQNLNLVVLDESEHEREDNGVGFSWTHKEKYRVLVLGDLGENEPSGKGVYRVGEFDEKASDFNSEILIEPSLAGRKLDRIPFAFINAKDLVPDPDDPPLLALAHLSMAVYRGEADYRQSLFMQGQDTLVIVGGVTSDDDLRAGAGARIEVSENGDAKYIGVSSDGLAEQRQALENDRRDAAEIGGRLLDGREGEADSGKALRIRMSARTATLNQLALAGAGGLQSVLRDIAVWIGAKPEDVVVTPNLDFVDDTLDAKSLLDYQAARNLGAPLSDRSLHRLMRQKDLTELEYEEEIEEIDNQPPGRGGTGTGVDPITPGDGDGGQ